MPLRADFLPKDPATAPDRNARTLWIFGAGASAHLHFPLSSGFLKSALSLITSEIRSFSGDSVSAFDQIGAKTSELDRRDLVRLQNLMRQIAALRERLSAVGITPETAALLDTPPEDLLQQIQQLDPADVLSRIGKGRSLQQVEMDISRAEECVTLIYFYALSEFNDRARHAIDGDADGSCYEQLVKAFIFETNARIISFNYDTVLDEALFRRFTRSWAYELIHLAGINGYPVSSGAEPDLLFIKPHGSLNMLVCPNCQRTHIQWFARSIPRGGGNLAADNRQCAHCKSRFDGIRSLLDGMLVPPLYDKEVIDGSKPAIRRAFQWANRIVSIGFSFPQQDSYFFDCMAEGLLANPSTEIRIWLVLQGSSGADGATTLRQRLLAEPRLRFLVEPKFSIAATDLRGFEAV
jgi:hypothetical protein